MALNKLYAFAECFLPTQSAEDGPFVECLYVTTLGKATVILPPSLFFVARVDSMLGKCYVKCPTKKKKTPDKEMFAVKIFSK